MSRIHVQKLIFVVSILWEISFTKYLLCLSFTVWKWRKFTLILFYQKFSWKHHHFFCRVDFTEKFLVRVNFLFFHTVCSMLLFFNSMCVYPFFFSLKTFVDDALCWTKSLLRVVEIWHHWIVDKHGKTFSIPTSFPFVVGAMLSDVCRSICKTILY